MRNAFIISVISAFLILQSCSLKDQLSVEVKKLDSVSIVLNSKLNELNKVDTALLDRAVSKFETYSTFIENNIRDTISKEEANSLQQFYQSGKNLKAFSVNYSNLRSRMNLVSDQIKKMRTDVDNGSIPKKEFLANYETEVKTASQLIMQCNSEMVSNINSIQDFKNSLLPVETLIKLRNNGLLPESINNKVEL